MVAEYNGKIVGTAAVLSQGKKTARLHRFYLLKSYRKKGFGSKLFDSIKLFKASEYRQFKKTKEQICFVKRIK